MILKLTYDSTGEHWTTFCNKHAFCDKVLRDVFELDSSASYSMVVGLKNPRKAGFMPVTLRKSSYWNWFIKGYTPTNSNDKYFERFDTEILIDAMAAGRKEFTVWVKFNKA